MRGVGKRFVYVLRSDSDSRRHYVGVTSSPDDRLRWHNAGGRRLHLWAREAGFDILHVDAYQPHYISGPYKNFWSWTFQERAPNVITMGLLTDERWRDIAH